MFKKKKKKKKKKTRKEDTLIPKLDNRNSKSA